jgi:serine/threonine protein kinase/tetratricopeptide (TPR) repeat protein
MRDPSTEQAIDEVCDQFEGRWRAGEAPVVEDYLRSVPESARDDLLRELLRLEIDYRRRRGEQPALGDYLPRWPQQNTLLQELLGEVLPSPRPAPARPRPPVDLQQTAQYEGTLPEAPAGTQGPSDERITRVLPPAAAPAGLPQQLGRYRVLCLLRQGATGTVYLADDSQADRQVAIKVPNLGPGSPPTAVERFRQSARAAARVTHPNLCPVYEVGEWQGVPFLVMPHLAMPSLADRLKEGLPFPPREAAELVRKLATAMQAAHRAGVIHRDLNPASILLDPAGDPIVVDFALARFVDAGAARLTQTGEVLGTPAYIAPEQLSGDPEAQGASCDVFSLGVILYELLTGEMPFGRTMQEVLLRIMTRDPVPPSVLRPEVGAELDAVCRKALACKVQDRYRNMGELAEALQGSPVRREHSTTRRMPRAGARRLLAPLCTRGGLLLLALLAGIALAGTVYYIRSNRGEPPATAPSALNGTMTDSDREAPAKTDEERKVAEHSQTGAQEKPVAVQAREVHQRAHDLAVRDSKPLIPPANTGPPPGPTDTRPAPDPAEEHYRQGNVLLSQKKFNDAEAAFREAVRLKPEFAEAHNNLGTALSGQRKLREAEAAFREAIRRKHDLDQPRINLGYLLFDQDRLAEAEAVFGEAIRIKPGLVKAHYGLGNVLREQDDLPGAVREFRKAIALAPSFAEAHCNLGRALQLQGQFAEALSERRRGHELAATRENWPYQSAEWVREAERLVELDGKLAAFLTKKATPADPPECLRLSQVCQYKRIYASAAQFAADAFAGDARLVEPVQFGARYEAACCAALAGCKQGEDANTLNEVARARWRRQALDWLRADLAWWGNYLEKGDAGAKALAGRKVRRWQTNRTLAGVRDADALARLPADERKEWQKLWADVAALVGRAGEPN